MTGEADSHLHKTSREAYTASTRSLLDSLHSPPSTVAPLEVDPSHCDTTDTSLAFSSGSTPALTREERGALGAFVHSSQDIQHSPPPPPPAGTLSALRDLLWRTPLQHHQPAGTDSNPHPAHSGSALLPVDKALSSLLLPSVKIRSDDTSERLYIASRNKVHRPRANPKQTQRQRTATSSSEGASSIVHTLERVHEQHNKASSRKSCDMAASPYSGPGSGDSSSITGQSQRSPQVTARDYGYSSVRFNGNHDYHHSISSSTAGSTTTGIATATGISPSSSSTHANISSLALAGGGGHGNSSMSSKASQMLGLVPSSSSSSSFHSSEHHRMASSDRSPITSNGTGSNGTMMGLSTQSHHAHHVSQQPLPSQISQSHTRMTLKKAKSLFSSVKNKGSTSPGQYQNLDNTTPAMPSSTSNRPMGMGSYGDMYASPPSSSTLSHHQQRGGTSSSNSPRYETASQSTLSHSKSHGSLQGTSYNHSISSYSPSSAPLPPLAPSSHDHALPHHHPYAASGTSRKTSQPVLPSQQRSLAGGTSILGGGTGAMTLAREQEQDTTCPICLESLSIRLTGEKPHVIPLCGHKLHNECFETAYNITVSQAIGDSPHSSVMNELGGGGGGGSLLSSARRKKKSIGICGICRSEMKIGDPGELGKNKFALLSGQPGRSGAPALDTHKIHSISKRTIGSEDEDDTPGSASLHNPSEDQDVLNPHQLLPAYMQHLALGGGVASGAAGHYVDRSIMPKISVRAEHTSLARQSDPEKRVHLTCLVTVEMPSRIPGLEPLSQQRLPTSVSQRSLPQQPHSAQNSQSTILGYELTNQNMASANDAGTRERSASHSGTAITGGSSSNHQHHLGMQRQHQSPSSAASQDGNGSVFRRESNATAHTHGTEDFPTSPSVSTFSGAGHHHTPGNYRGSSSVQAHSSAGMEKSMSGMTSISSTGHGLSQTPATTASAGFTPHSTTASSFDEQDEHQPSASSAALSNGMNRVDSMPGYNTSLNMSSITLTAAAQEEKTREAHGPFADVFKDLQDRMMDWKGHEPSTFGSLRMYDSLSVKKDKNVREFVVYLFEEALLCVVDDRKRSGTSSAQAAEEEHKLRLKGRVFVKHMKQVEDTSSVSGGLSLTIHMEDDSLESFVILFPHREILEVWRSQIQALIDHHRPPIPSSTTKSSMTTSGSRRDSVFSNETNRSAQSSFSRNTKATTSTSFSNASAGPVPSGAIPPVPTLKKSMQSMHVNPLLDWTPPDPATFTPLDLMLVLSVPRAAHSMNGPSSNGLKLRLIKSTLDFIIHAVGPRARISIVAYTTGDSSTSSLKKTPWLATGRPDGMRRLEQAVAELAGDSSDRYVEGLTFVDPKEEKVTVATAVNLALDIMLQRTSKSATCGMLLLNDGKDGAQKQHIDLILARADAGGIPIHTFGWGKSHDPSSLWLLSNHTKGTYTFVRDFYQLREAMAGCIGGMLCVALHHLRLHLNVQERRWFKIRKVAGVASAIVSSDGKDVDISLGELRFGEKKEMLVEIEMSSPKKNTSRRNSSNHIRTNSKEQTLSRKKSMTATDDFFLKKVGMDPHSLGGEEEEDLASGNFFDEVEEGMADDVPVFDVNASFKNPHDLSGEVRKLPYPSLLTITVTPPVKNSNNAPDSPASSSTSGTVSDPTIVRRRMELLTSDMITRTLLLMSRRQDSSAQRLLVETTRIFNAITANLIPPNVNESTVSAETRYANDVLQACLEDIEQLKKGSLDRAEFDTATRNFGAQQAVALRDQRAWTARTSTEALFFSREWTAIFGRAYTNPL